MNLIYGNEQNILERATVLALLFSPIYVVS